VDGNGTSLAILVGVWATFALDVFSTLNSSPQTTEINVQRRQESLMYWVAICAAVAIGGGAIATTVSRKAWPLVATATVAAGMYLLYVHAKRRGLARANEGGTEDTGGGGVSAWR
jgi:preprotein translocase subunit SecY